MKSALQNHQRILLNPVNQPMFVGNPSGPAPAESILQRFRLAEARKRIALNIAD
jgi:hypothetical protein